MTSITFEYQSVTYTMTTSATMNADFSSLVDDDEQSWIFSPALQLGAEVVSNPQVLIKSTTGSGNHYLQLDYYSSSNSDWLTILLGYHGSGTYAYSSSIGGVNQNIYGTYSLSTGTASGDPFITPILQ
jgi:hypothetical protein